LHGQSRETSVLYEKSPGQTSQADSIKAPAGFLGLDGHCESISALSAIAPERLAQVTTRIQSNHGTASEST
jgi:hypothetical protein